MSAINVDRIAPKHGASIRIDTSSPVVLQPTMITLSGALTDTGSVIAGTTVTGTLICDGDIVYLGVDVVSFTSVSTTFVTSPLLVGTNFIPSTEKWFPFYVNVTKGSPTRSLLRGYIDTTGVVYFPCEDVTILYSQVLKFNLR